MNNFLYIETSKHTTTREEIERYDFDIKNNTTRELLFPSFKKILRLKTNHPQKVFDCFHALGQFTQYKASRK
jgi:hypothetical protein